MYFLFPISLSGLPGSTYLVILYTNIDPMNDDREPWRTEQERKEVVVSQ